MNVSLNEFMFWLFVDYFFGGQLNIKQNKNLQSINVYSRIGFWDPESGYV